MQSEKHTMGGDAGLTMIPGVLSVKRKVKVKVKVMRNFNECKSATSMSEGNGDWPTGHAPAFSSCY